MRVLRGGFTGPCSTALSPSGITLTAALICSRARSSSPRGIGSEFMPPLNEGDMMFMPIADPSISLEENTEIREASECRAEDVSGSRLRGGQGRARRHLDRSRRRST